nr:hypothetical protein Iba_chr07bCG10740 [Ipomoea batatas]
MDLLYSSVGSGQHWQFSCRRYLFLGGYFNTPLSDRSLTVIGENVYLYNFSTEMCKEAILVDPLVRIWNLFLISKKKLSSGD